MAIYTVYRPPYPLSDPEDAALRTIFVKEGIAWAAMAFPLLWFLFHRLWLVLLGYLGAIALLEGLALWAGLGIAGITTLLVSILIGLEANNLRCWTLARRGWVLSGVVAGRSLDICIHRYFNAEQLGDDVFAPPPGAPATRHQATPTTTPPTTMVPTGNPDEVLGVFPSAEKI
jgi:hypothetical protein